MNSLRIINTADGSPTLLNTQLGVTYHSRFGALAESRHIYITNGFSKALQNFPGKIHVIEMGFGTGLNALLTLEESGRAARPVTYFAIEKFPLPATVWEQLDYTSIAPSAPSHFRQLHEAEWNSVSRLGAGFELIKTLGDLLQLTLPQAHIVYYDAFDPVAQPELWTTGIFQKLYTALFPGGLLVTYCAKGIVKRNLMAAGFKVERFPGPPGKRECTLARKIV